MVEQPRRPTVSRYLPDSWPKFSKLSALVYLPEKVNISGTFSGKDDHGDGADRWRKEKVQKNKIQCPRTFTMYCHYMEYFWIFFFVPRVEGRVGSDVCVTCEEEDRLGFVPAPSRMFGVRVAPQMMSFFFFFWRDMSKARMSSSAGGRGRARDGSKKLWRGVIKKK